MGPPSMAPSEFNDDDIDGNFASDRSVVVEKDEGKEKN
jgi:hypothetical protein